MSNERRYDEDEVTEILDRATATEAVRGPESAAATGTGFTLSQLQEIASEVQLLLKD